MNFALKIDETRLPEKKNGKIVYLKKTAKCNKTRSLKKRQKTTIEVEVVL